MKPELSPWKKKVLHRLYLLLRQEPGLSYPMITAALNEEFGLQLTNNAVIGKAHRMKTGKQPYTPPPPPPRPPRPAAPRPYPLNAPQPSLRLTIYELTDLTCKWPGTAINEWPPYSYCGQPTELGLSYCPQHCEIAYGGNKRT
jgi:hypothetical protein